MNVCHNSNSHLDSKINSIAFSPNDQTLVSGDEDHKTILYDVSTGEIIES
jgi:WD40 repeat protein